MELTTLEGNNFLLLFLFSFWVFFNFLYFFVFLSA